MTTLSQANEAVMTRFLTNWGTTTPVVLDNENPINQPTLPWVRAVIRGLENEQETLGTVGNRRFLRRAMLMIQVFTSLNIGSEAADLLVTTARNIFEGARFSGIWFFHGDVIPIGVTEDGVYQVNLEMKFNYEEVK